MSWKVHAVLSLLLSLVPIALVAAPIGEGRYKLGLVLEKTGSGQDGDVLNAATDAFVATHCFSMVARSQLDALFTEKDLQMFLGGHANDKLVDILGLDLLGLVGYTVEPSHRLQGRNALTWIIDVRLVVVKTAVFLATVSSNRPSLSTSASTPREAGQLLYQNIRETFPPQGYVIFINGKEAVIDLGSEAGLKTGDIFEVGERKQYIHPLTRERLLGPISVTGELKVLTTSPQTSTCKIKSARGAVREANFVRLKRNNSLLEKLLSAIYHW